MVRHYIIVASAYSIGKRIALDYCSSSKIEMDKIDKDVEYILEKYGKDAPLAKHFILTSSADWSSVALSDHFFDDVELMKNKEEFTEILLKDKELSGVDVARYILTKIPCTHLKLEKLVYMCYADYLCKEDTKLFKDVIYAYKLGPIVDSVYKKYKKNGADYIDNEKTYNEISKKMPIRSRVISSHEGLKKLISIDRTLQKYGDFSASKLVDLTHKELSPWFKTKENVESNDLITDDLIKEYHKYETL